MRTRTYAGWPMTPMVKKILIINIAIWVVQLITEFWLRSQLVTDLFAITPERVYPGWFLWQPFTYMWLHSPHDLSHILLNMLFFWMFGSTLELSWGSKAFLRFYLYCGVGAGLTVFLSGKIFAPYIPVLGASGAIFGLVAAWAIAFPNHVIYFYGLFPIKGKHFVLIPIGYAVFDFIRRAQGVSHAAHLGGMAIGALLITGYWRPDKLRKKLRYWWLRRKLRVLEGSASAPKNSPPGGGYWH